MIGKAKTYEILTEAFNKAKEENVPNIYANNNKIGMSQRTKDLIKDREDAIMYNDNSEANELVKKYKKVKTNINKTIF